MDEDTTVPTICSSRSKSEDSVPYAQAWGLNVITTSEVAISTSFILSALKLSEDSFFGWDSFGDRVLGLARNKLRPLLRKG